MSDDSHDDEWTLWWDARLAAMERVLGKSDDMVGHGVVPFHLGPELGGAADIVYFRQHVPGVVAVTAELIGIDEQLENEQGNYELMICHREDEPWGPDIVCQLALYTLFASLVVMALCSLGSIAAAVYGCQSALGTWPLSPANLNYSIGWGAAFGLPGGLLASLLLVVLPGARIPICAAVSFLVVAASGVSLFVYTAMLAAC
jgi:hypothetical protein